MFKQKSVYTPRILTAVGHAELQQEIFNLAESARRIWDIDAIRCVNAFVTTSNISSCSTPM